LILLALTAANVVLAVLLLSGIRSCRGGFRDAPAPTSSAVTIDAAASDARPSGSDAVGAAESSPDTAELCTTLARRYDAQAGKSFIGAAAGSLCGDEETALAVTQTLMSQLPAEPDGTEPGDKPDAEDKSDGNGADNKSDKKSGAKSEKKSGKSKKPSRDGKKRSKKADK
jgi:hypothetical protein